MTARNAVTLVNQIKVGAGRILNSMKPYEMLVLWVVFFVCAAGVAGVAACAIAFAGLWAKRWFKIAYVVVLFLLVSGAVRAAVIQVRPCIGFNLYSGSGRQAFCDLPRIFRKRVVAADLRHQRPGVPRDHQPLIGRDHPRGNRTRDVLMRGQCGDDTDQAHRNNAQH
jgi:hypothetical protein